MRTTEMQFRGKAITNSRPRASASSGPTVGFLLSRLTGTPHRLTEGLKVLRRKCANTLIEFGAWCAQGRDEDAMSGQRSLERLPALASAMQRPHSKWSNTAGRRRDQPCVSDTHRCSAAGPLPAIGSAHSQCCTYVKNIRPSLSWWTRWGLWLTWGEILWSPAFQSKYPLFPKRQNRFPLCCVSSDVNAVWCSLYCSFIRRSLINMLQDHIWLEIISSRVSLHWKKMAFM